MDVETFARTVLGLRTNPFLPRVGHDGLPIKTETIEPSLNPAVDDRVLRYYFDVYDWKESLLVREVSREEALKTFPQPGDLQGDATLLIIISGNSQTGRDSLANLVLHKIQLATSADPLVVPVRLGFDSKANALNTAMQFVDTFEVECSTTDSSRDALAKMRARVKQVTDAPPTDGNYSNLFMGLRRVFDTASSRPVVVRALDGDHGAWSQIYDATRDLVSFIIATTADPVNAEACYRRMRARARNVAWVRAGLLDVATFRSYVRQRIADERTAEPAPTNDVAPFTDEALALLFEPGFAATGRVLQGQSIGFLRRRLRRAFEEAAKVKSLTIDVDVMRRACDALNRGN